MHISLSNNWKWKYVYRPYYRTIEILSRFYFKHRIKVYRCKVCGMMEAPFLEEKYNSLPHDFGWHQFKNRKWICHHCADHFGEIPQDEWKGFVRSNNRKVKHEVLESKYGKRFMRR